MHGYKKRLEFAQKIVVTALLFSVAIVVLTLLANFFLLWFDKQSMAQETIATISTFGGILSGVTVSAYAALTAVRNCSQNKWDALSQTDNEEDST